MTRAAAGAPPPASEPPPGTLAPPEAPAPSAKPASPPLDAGALPPGSDVPFETAAGLGAGDAPRLTDSAALARAASFYDSARYENCVSAFTALLDPESPSRLTNPHAVEDARVYLAACLLAVGDADRADEQFRTAIRENPQIQPPEPVVFPGAVVDRFFLVRASMLTEIRAAQRERIKQARAEAREEQRRIQAERDRVRRLEEASARETLVQQNSRWFTLVPFGVGQFHNDDHALGWVFLGVETALLTTAVAGVGLELHWHSRASVEKDQLDISDLNTQIRRARWAGQIGLVGFAATALIGVVESNLSFEPERGRGTRRRELPPDLRPVRGPEARVRITPTLGQGHVGVGVAGWF